MLHKTKVLFTQLFILCIITGCVLLHVSLAAADSALPAPSLSLEDLQSNDIFDKAMSLETKRLPLGTVLEKLSSQTGATLTIRTESPLRSKLVTMKVANMKTYDVMTALARIYVAEWIAETFSKFVLQERSLDAIDKGISQIGTPALSNYSEKLFDLKAPSKESTNTRNRYELYKKIMEVADVNALKSENGTPVKSLPVEVVNELKVQYKRSNVLSLLDEYSAYKRIPEYDVLRLKLKLSDRFWTEEPTDSFWDKDISIELRKANWATEVPSPMTWNIPGSILARYLDEKGVRR